MNNDEIVIYVYTFFLQLLKTLKVENKREVYAEQLTGQVLQVLKHRDKDHTYTIPEISEVLLKKVEEIISKLHKTLSEEEKEFLKQELNKSVIDSYKK